ncbi:MFS transporter [Nocardia sp. NPDC003963]
MAVSGFVGTAIEYYDFFIFGTAAALVFGKVYFPSLNPLTALLASFATFAVAFIARPIGGILFGHFGDRLGRKTMLVTSLLMMGLATVAVGLLPGYETIGVAAPILLVTLRFVQGIGLGGEFGGAMLMIAEHAPPQRRGFFASLAQLGPPVGLALSSLTFLLLSAVMGEDAFLTWGWRVAFVASALLVIVGMYVRLNVSESPVFRELTRRQEQVRVPIAELLRTQRGRLLLAAGPSILSSVLFFLITTYSLSYGTEELGVSRTTMLLVVLAVVVVNAVVTVPLGGLSDRIGRRRTIRAGIIGSVVWAVPMFLLVQTGNPVVMALAFSVGIVLYTLVFAPLGAFLPELFDTRTRYTGTSVAFNLGAMLGGALAPSIATKLGDTTDHAWWILPGYIVVVAVIAMACLGFLPETRNSALDNTSQAGVSPRAATDHRTGETGIAPLVHDTTAATATDFRRNS